MTPDPKPTPALLACLRCGGPIEIFHDYAPKAPDGHSYNWRCKDCNLSNCFPFTGMDGRENAIADANRRAPLPVEGAAKPVAWDERPNVEHLIQEVLPGGSVCDPQQVADEIRRYFDRVPTYDDAVRALAPFLPDGWVAQEEPGDLWHSTGKPILGERGWDDEELTEMFEFTKMKVPRCPDWRLSLRRIENGKAVTP